MGRQNRSRHHHNMGCRFYIFSVNSRALSSSAFWPTAHTHMMLDLYENGQPILRYWRLCQIKLAWSGQGDFAVSLDEKTLPISSQIYKAVPKVAFWCIAEWSLHVPSRRGGRGVSFVCFRSARWDWGCRGNLSLSLCGTIHASFVVSLYCLVENCSGKLRWYLRSLITHKHQWSK